MTRRAKIATTLMTALFTTTVVAVIAAQRASAATYGPATMLDVSPDAQFDKAESSVISADGRYVAFHGTVNGQTGIWRRDLQTGALDPVAVNLPGLSQIASQYDPQAPSISGDGRYIAFNTEAALDPANDDPTTSPRPWQVYVRDMAVPAGAPGEYTLASAVNGGTKSLTYGDSNGAHIAGWTGTQAPGTNLFESPGGAISADGRMVVFSVDSPSTLVSQSTPPGQVAVRGLDTHTTTLVSVCTNSCAAGGTQVGGPVNWPNLFGLGGATVDDDAVISADGTTVAWLSQFGAVQQEAPTLANEQILYGGQPAGLADVEAVWRRIADGPAAPTLRITGEVDALRPGCPAGAQVTLASQPPAACEGPLDAGNSSGSAFSHLSLSGDGYEVVLLSPAPLFTSQDQNPTVEAYLVDMHNGLTRDQATTALTQASAAAESTTKESPIVADAISPDGSTIALSTMRTRFDLQSPSYVGPARANVANGNELYIVNRRDDTLDLVTYAYNGTLANYPGFGASGLSPSLSSDGSLVAFDSTATDLVWGDGNNASNVYVESRIGAAGGSGSSAPLQQPVDALSPLVTQPWWVLHASAQSLANGNLTLYVLVPGAGRIGVRASAKLTVPHMTRHGLTVRQVARTVATANSSTHAAGLAKLTVHLRRAYLALSGRKGGLGATARLTFSLAGSRAVLHDTLTVTFRRLHQPAKGRR
jgi:hypothetical protein